MGLDPLTASLIVGAVGTAFSVNESANARRAQKEGRAISGAQDKQEAIRMSRQKAREARVRKAQILQASENTGVSDSSGQVGALAAVMQSQNAQQSYLSGQELTAARMSTVMQDEADSMFRSQIIGGVTNLFSSYYGAKASQSKK